jgi:N-acetylmuramoyl-L-alanine amidase
VYSSKQLLRTLLTVVCLVSMPIASQAAGSVSSVQVAVDKLNVRSGPSLNDSVLTTLPAKTVLPVIAEKDNWVQVQLPGGRKGWLANWLVKPSGSSAAASQIESQIENLNVRSGPSLTFPVVQTISPNTKYPVLQKSAQWVQIQLSAQQKGWVAGWLVTEHSSSQPSPPTAEDTQSAPVANTLTLDFSPYVYPEPNENLPAIGQLQAGTAIEKLSQTNGWIQFPYGGVNAWIRLPDSGSNPPPQPEPTPDVTAPPASPAPPVQTATATVKSASLNLRSEANTTSTILGSLSQGTTLELLQNQGDWYQVKTPDGRTGWVAGWLLEVNKQSEDVPAQAMLTILNPDTNVRSGPGTTYDIVTRVQNGERFAIVKQEDDWFQIRLSDGKTGYVAGWLVEADGVAPVVRGNELVGKIIVVDAGHGGNDNGATGSSFSTLEKTINLQVALMLRNKLEAAGAKVIMTRSDDRKLTLQQRVDTAIQNKADVFVSIHHNTHPNTMTNGTIVFYYNKGNSSKLASLVQNEIVKATNYKDLQSRFGNYFVLRENPVVSILAEIGFLSNYNDEIRLRSAKQQDLAAEGLYKGLLQYFASLKPQTGAQ